MNDGDNGKGQQGMILTVSRQLGTNERAILAALSQRLGLPVITRNEVEAAAERLGILDARAGDR